MAWAQASWPTRGESQARSVVPTPPGLGEDMRELWHDIGQVAIGTLPGWVRAMYGFGPPDPELMEREQVRQLIGALDLGFESLPGVVEARERIELRMRRWAGPGPGHPVARPGAAGLGPTAR